MGLPMGKVLLLRPPTSQERRKQLVALAADLPAEVLEEALLLLGQLSDRAPVAGEQQARG